MSIAVLAFVGCGQSRTGEIPVESISVGGVFALTGLGAAIGEQEYMGAQLAVEEVNTAGGIDGKQVKFVVEDVSLDKLSSGPSAVQKLVNVDNVVGIVGPTWDEPAAQILPIIEEARIPILMPDQTVDVESLQSFSFAFSTWYDNRVGVRELLRYAQSHDLKRIAIVRSVAGGFWQFTRDEFVMRAPEFGVEVVEDIDVGNPLELDFRTVLIKVKEKRPDAIFAVVTDYNECAFLKQMKELGINVPLLSTESSGTAAALGQCPDLMENVFFSTPHKTHLYKDFAQRFKAKFEHEPQFPSVATSYDAMKILLSVIEETGSTDGKVLREGLKQLDEYQGVSFESIYFDEMGFVKTPEDAFEMMTVREGAFVSVP
ncbi:ABC transporter substrate-binding protein [Candidatus Nomurabacteria bacterium]|nr:ABC transporter substrate-binding protein [Candidatus Nomurabacteria bacterium]